MKKLWVSGEISCCTAKISEAFLLEQERLGRVALPTVNYLLKSLPIIWTLFYFFSSLVNVFPLVRVVLAFPSLFLFPGAMLLLLLRKNVVIKDLKIIVEAFFASLLLLVISTAVMIAFGVNLTPFYYSLIALINASLLSLILLINHVSIRFSRSNHFLLFAAFIAFVLLALYFGGLPRLFTHDEATYISNARFLVVDGTSLPMGVPPFADLLTALLRGRPVWIYTLASFLGSTGLAAQHAGLVGIPFLLMTALTSSLLVKKKLLRLSVFIVVLMNPLLFLFSALTLNDLVIAFFITFSVVFFVKSFSKTNDKILINNTNLLYSLLGIVTLMFIKPNFFIVFAMWVTLFFIAIRYKLYKQGKHAILTITVLLLPLIYELCIDIPHKISIFYLQNNELTQLFGRFLFESPLERFLSMFVGLPWAPEPALFTHSYADYMQYLNIFLAPESLSILISATVMALPVLMLWKGMRQNFQRNLLVSLSVISLIIGFLQFLTFNIVDHRYFLWIFPLWTPLALGIIYKIVKNCSFEKFVPIYLSMFIILAINLEAATELGKVYVGFSLPSVRTSSLLLLQLLFFSIVLSLLILKKRQKITIAFPKFSLFKKVNLKKLVFSLVIFSIFVSQIYFTTWAISESSFFRDSGFTEMSQSLDEGAGRDGIVFANNFMSLVPYVSDERFKNSMILSPPATESQFRTLFKVSPNGTQLLISDDSATTFREYGNNYIKKYKDYNLMVATDNSIKANPDIINRPIFYLNGNDNFIEMPHHLDLAPDNITVMLWVKKTNGEFGLLRKGTAGSAYYTNYEIFYREDKIEVRFGIGGEQYACFRIGDPKLNEWTHIAFVFEDKKEFRSYQDGLETANASTIFSYYKDDSPLTIGTLFWGYEYRHFLEGAVANIQIYNRTLSAEEIDYNYKHSMNPITKGLTLWLPLDKNNGTIIHDASGNMNHGIIHGNPSWVIDNPSCYMDKIREIQLPINASAELFKIIKNIEGHYSTVDVKSAEVYFSRPSGQDTVTIDLSMDSPEAKNVTILIGTNLCTNVYNVPLSSGENSVSFQFEKDPSDTAQFVLLAQPKVIIIEDGRVVYTSVLSVWEPQLMNVAIIVVAMSILMLYSFAKIKETQCKPDKGC
jgi:hypothetical protein